MALVNFGGCWLYVNFGGFALYERYHILAAFFTCTNESLCAMNLWDLFRKYLGERVEGGG